MNIVVIASTPGRRGYPPWVPRAAMNAEKGDFVRREWLWKVVMAYPTVAFFYIFMKQDFKDELGGGFNCIFVNKLICLFSLL